MDICRQCEDLIQACDDKILIKVQEKQYISALVMDEITKRVKLNQVQAEIDELRSQRNYYSDFFRDQCIKSSINCDSCCCNGSCCYKW